MCQYIGNSSINLAEQGHVFSNKNIIIVSFINEKYLSHFINISALIIFLFYFCLVRAIKRTEVKMNEYFKLILHLHTFIYVYAYTIKKKKISIGLRRENV